MLARLQLDKANGGAAALDTLMRSLPHAAARQHLKHCDLMVITSRMEGGANVIIEAVTSGVAVVASDISGNRGMLGDDYAGYFQAGDCAALAALIERCAVDASFYQLLQNQCALRAALSMVGALTGWNEKRVAEGKEATAAKEKFTTKQVELATRVREANARIMDPLEQKSSSEYRKLQSDLEEYVKSVEAASGRESAAYKNAVDFKKQMLGELNQTEGLEQAAGWAKRTREIRQGLMTETQQRKMTMMDEIKMIDLAVAKFQGSEEAKIEYVRQAEETKAAIRAQYAKTDPFTKQMAEWSDLSGNLQKAATGWMDNIAGGITDLIMGTGDLKSAINGIIKDMVNMGVKAAMSGMFGGAKGGGAKAGGGGGGKAKAALGGGGGKGKGAAVGLFHSGGILGDRAPGNRMAAASLFTNAPRFHTGGILGAPRLKPNEMPIIGMKGEGMFTQAQMKNLAPAGTGGSSISISSPITVNGSAGTPEQNKDLADQMARQFEASVRTTVATELRVQMRQGNTLNRRS